MMYSGSQRWIPFGSQDLVASADGSHFLMSILMSIQMSMEVISDHVCGNVCLSVMIVMICWW